MRLLLLIIIISLLYQSSVSQTDHLHFKNISTNNGLSQNWVKCIYQDDLGYMWFGTADGLNRFDGYDFKIFLPDPDEKYSIGSMYINSISRKSEYELWICSHNGVYIYNQKQERFYKMDKLPAIEVKMILEDSKKEFWFATSNGLYKFNSKDNTVQLYTQDKNKAGTISNNNIQCIFEDSKHNLWVSTFAGIELYDRKSDSFVFFDISKHLDLNSRTRVWTMVEDRKGKIWCGIKQAGVYIFNYNLEKPENSDFDFVQSGSPNCMQFDHDANLWVGNGGSLGLDILHAQGYNPKQTLKREHYFQTGTENQSISSNSISSIYMDRFGDMWIGTYGAGVDYYSKRTKKFNNFSASNEKNSISSNLVNALLEDDKYLWIGTELGLDRKDKATGEIVHFKNNKSNPSSIGANAIYKLLKDKKDNLWIGSWNGGLSLYNSKTENFKNYLPNNQPGSIKSSNIFDIQEDSKGNLWIATNGGGLNKFEPITGNFTAFLNDPGNPLSINGNSINGLCVGSDGKIWVSLYGIGLDRFDEVSGTFTHFTNIPGDSKSISSGFILSIFEDSKKNIWVASNMGLNLYNQKDQSFKHYTTKKGLPNNTIQAILEDEKGNLWLSTNNGLAVFYNAVELPEIPEFKIYNKKDGLSTNEFNTRAGYKNSDGMMYFGTTQGYISFYPKSIKDNSIPPIIVLTDFSLFETHNKKTERKTLYRNEINYESDIKLSYDQSNFIIRFAALNYLNSEKNQYKYCLKGYDDGWHLSGNLRFAPYTNIQPGNYTFMVYGSNNDGIWSDSPKTIRIIISPPWWQNIFFRIFLVLMVIGALFLLYRIRIRILENQKKILKQTVEERTMQLQQNNVLLEERNEEIAIQNEELSKHRNNLENLIIDRTSELEIARLKAEESDRLKSAFLANLSHEIRTPMNAVLGFSNLLEEEGISAEDRRRFIKMINSNGESLLHLIDDIIDISMIESNQLILKMGEFDINQVLLELESNHQKNNEKPIEIEFSTKQEKSVILHSDRIRIKQIFNNLLNNACKYTDSGSVKFGYQIEENKIRFFVIDTGIGIAKEHIEGIFNRFGKVHNHKGKIYRGTGIGLAICKSLVTKLGGEILVNSKPDVGSEFTFTLPFNPGLRD